MKQKHIMYQSRAIGTVCYVTASVNASSGGKHTHTHTYTHTHTHTHTHITGERRLLP